MMHEKIVDALTEACARTSSNVTFKIIICQDESTIWYGEPMYAIEKNGMLYKADIDLMEIFNELKVME